MIRFTRIDGHVFKVVRLPPRDLTSLIHLDRTQRVLFVQDDFTDHEVRELVTNINKSPPAGGGKAAA